MKVAVLFCVFLVSLFTLPTQLNGACTTTYWGYLCNKRCWCASYQKCNFYSGACPGGQCDNQYHNSYCNALRARLVKAPTLKVVQCPKVMVTWPRWTKGDHTGSQISSVYGYVVRVSCKNIKIHEFNVSPSTSPYLNVIIPQNVQCTFSIKVSFKPTYSTSTTIVGPESPSVTIPELDCTGNITARPYASSQGVYLTWSYPAYSGSVKYRLKSVPTANFPFPIYVNFHYIRSLQMRKSYVFAVSRQTGVTNTWSPWIYSKPIMLLGETETVRKLSFSSYYYSGSKVVTMIRWNRPLQTGGISYFEIYAQVLDKRPSYRTVSSVVKQNVSAYAQFASLRLPSACRIKLTVSAYYKDGSVTQKAPASNALLFWTRPNRISTPPPKPSQADNSKGSQITVLVKPSLYNEGPLEYYIAIVRNYSRTRRSVPLEFGLPYGARITHKAFKFPNPRTSTSMKIIIGNGSLYSDNPPLLPNTAYSIYYVALSRVQEVNASVHAKTVLYARTASLQTMSSAAVAGVVVSMICIFAVLFVGLGLYCCRQRRHQARPPGRSQAIVVAATAASAHTAPESPQTGAFAPTAPPNAYDNVAFSQPATVPYPPPYEPYRPPPSNPYYEQPPSYNSLFQA